MKPGTECRSDGSLAIIGCGHTLDVVAEDMVCLLGTDCVIRIGTCVVRERTMDTVILGESCF